MLPIVLDVWPCSSCHGKWFNDEVSGVFPDVVPLKTQEVGAVNLGQFPAPARISANNYSSWSSSLQVSWKGEDCGKINEFLLSSDNVSLPQSKS
jgi:hypothetical protein